MNTTTSATMANKQFIRVAGLWAIPMLALMTLAIWQCRENTYQMGERLYKAQCANCHLDQGEGLGALIPPLAGSDYLAKHREKLPCIVRYGLTDTITVNGKQYAEQMVGNNNMNDIQITNVVNYILQNWGNNVPPLTFEEVEKALQQCKQ